MARHPAPPEAHRARLALRTGVLLFGFAAGAAVAASQAVADENGPATALPKIEPAEAALALMPTAPRAVHDELATLNDAEQFRREKTAQQEKRRAEAEKAARERVYAPVTGVITSNYGPRWGTTHYGLDIANRVGTPIRTPLAGTVIEAGPASGFGLWVRIRHDDGTTTVYGHIDSYAVRTGERVTAGQVIAEVGNRGISTGPHLHFEVWSPSGRKTDPLAWLQARGADIRPR